MLNLRVYWLVLLTAVLVWLVFLVLTGTLAHRNVSRQARSAGQEPPPYWPYILRPLAGMFTAPVVVPRWFRVLLGIVLFGGGLFFLLVVIVLVSPPASRATTLGSIAILTCLALLGIVSLYAAFRLIKMPNSNERLFKFREDSEDLG